MHRLFVKYIILIISCFLAHIYHTFITFKTVALTPFVLSLLELTLSETRFEGSIGSLNSLFSARVSSSRWVSLEKAPSSISEMRLAVRSILFNVAVIKIHINNFRKP